MASEIRGLGLNRSKITSDGVETNFFIGHIRYMPTRGHTTIATPPPPYLAVPALAAAVPVLGTVQPVPVQPGLGQHTAAGTAGNKQPKQPGGLQMEAHVK